MLTDEEAEVQEAAVILFSAVRMDAAAPARQTS